ncbi:MAG: molybdenum cofactor biosynthesis protein MoaE [Acidobacteriota bacterium]|nr:molybdenum cofactor biosynthesis protein MoaE [Acidobacteriota bacterium]
MHAKVLFFGLLKDIVGRSEDRVEIATEQPLGELFDRYAGQFPRLREMSASIVLACNHEFCERTAIVRDGDEVAFLPPVSGGTGQYTHEIRDQDGVNLVALTRTPIDTASVAKQLLRGEDGALVNFEGVVRNNTKGRATRFLDYECYEPMAIKVMAEIGREIARAQAIDRIAIIHRLGRMEVGETSVAVLVTAPHRRPAFEAALEGINRLKRLVPIWKKEHFADGEVWVEGEWDESVIKR